MCALAGLLSETGDLDAAIKIVPTIPAMPAVFIPPSTSMAYGSIASGRALAGDLEGAIATALKLNDSGERQSALQGAASGYSQRLGLEKVYRR